MIEIDFRLQAFFKHDDAANVFVSYCPALDIYSQGRSLQEAHAAITSAVTMFVRYQYREKKLDDFLNARGFEPTDDATNEEWINVDEKDAFTHSRELRVPLNLLVAADHMKRISGIQ